MKMEVYMEGELERRIGIGMSTVGAMKAKV